PVDFILAGSDQIRGWFHLLLVASMVSFGKHPSKAVYMHGLINDIEGKKMSKSIGNVISPYEIIDKYGVDTLRFYLTGNSEAGTDMNFSWDECQLTYRNFFVLWNVHNFLLDITKNNKLNPRKLGTLEEDMFGVEEKYILSKTHTTIRKATQLMEQYAIHSVPKLLESLYLDISRTYIQMVRDKAATGETEDKAVVAYCLYKCLMEFLKLSAPVMPYLSEQIYQNLKEEYGLKEESIHLFDWPAAEKKYINEELEESMDISQTLIQSILSARDKAQIGRRWPLKEALVATKDEKTVKAAELMRDIIMQQTNIKALNVVETMPETELTVKPDFAKIQPAFKELSPKIIAKLAMDSKETIMSHIDTNGSFDFQIDGRDVSITKDHLIIEKKVPYPYLEMPFSRGSIYINQERTEELEAEGYAREVMRFVQSMRKKAGLEKADKISILIQVDGELADMLVKWKPAIQEKIGASLLSISELAPAKKHAHSDKFKIKDKEINAYFDKV
ncbi:class I tRNA ligase family protein, partial [Candidatus Woesearchaeota archaeon]|nr:class I tRNA ligase family protein [Candidatus Woesearchaeota archaeon]